MTTYFQVVKQVLDGLYQDLPAEKRHEGITGALQHLSNKYQTFLTEGGPDYSTLEAKFAYIFRYTTAHADFLDAVIRQCAEIGAQTKQTNLIVSCIGGGPGSDILGFVKYLLPINPKPHLTFFLLVSVRKHFESNPTEEFCGLRDRAHFQRNRWELVDRPTWPPYEISSTRRASRASLTQPLYRALSQPITTAPRRVKPADERPLDFLHDRWAADHKEPRDADLQNRS